MNFIDTKYISLLAPYFQRFKQKKENLWNFRCPYCGDSDKNKIKARGYIFFTGEVFLYKCQNCTYSTNLYELIKHVDPLLYRSYALEKFSHKTIKIKNSAPKVSDVTYRHLQSKRIKFIDPVSTLSEDHWVTNYIAYRKIPTKFWSNLYYVPDFKEFVHELDANQSENLIQNDPRLVIPFYNENNELIGFQGRTLSGNKAKYITILLDENALKVYGLEKIKKDQLIQVVEGPIDSMFLPNAVATCDSDLSRAAKYFTKENLLLIWDNQYSNKDIRRSLIKAINDGFNVCIFPKSISHKDINDMVINGMTIKEVNNLIEENTFSGLRATFELCNR